MCAERFGIYAASFACVQHICDRRVRLHIAHRLPPWACLLHPLLVFSTVEIAVLSLMQSAPSATCSTLLARWAFCCFPLPKKCASCSRHTCSCRADQSLVHSCSNLAAGLSQQVPHEAGNNLVHSCTVPTRCIRLARYTASIDAREHCHEHSMFGMCSC